MTRIRLISLLVLLPAALAPAAASAKRDHAKYAYDVLPPGESGSIPPDAHSTDQLGLYDGLTPLGGNVTMRDLKRFFKPETLGATGRVRREKTGKCRVTVLRDKYDVPHIIGGSRAHVLCAAGWVTAENRGALLESIRNPGKLAATDAPGVDPFAIATSLRPFAASTQANNLLAREVTLLRHAGKRGRQVISDIEAYDAGINAFYRKTHNSAHPWTIADSLAVGSLIGEKFGKDGGNEARSSAFLGELEQRLGAGPGLGVFRDLSGADDPEAPTTVPGRFPYEPAPAGATPGSPVVDPGSLDAAAQQTATVAAGALPQMSNALLVGAKRSSDRHPLAVMGPQTGYTYPNIFLEVDLKAPGLDTRGALLAGLPYVLIGRGPRYAWSITSADADNTDQFLEQLCNPDGSPPTRSSTSYMYKGKCTRMGSFDAGMLGAQGTEPARELTFPTTVHGPVGGTVTVGGKPYAVATDRSTHGRDGVSLLPVSQLDSGTVNTPKSFIKTVSGIEFTFNWNYANNKHIAFFTTGRLPLRAPGVDPRLAALGTGQFDWRGFLKPSQHPQAIDPRGGLLLNWNNRPAQGFGAADTEWGTWDSVDRVQLFTGFKRRNRLSDVVGVMNRAATQDVRVELVWPTIAKVLATGPAPDPRTQQEAAILTAWVAHGGNRLDLNNDGKIDDPGAAIMDAAWPPLAKAVLSPALGSNMTDELASFVDIDRNAASINHGATSSFGRGWYGYVDKDLRSILGLPVKGPYSRRYCGSGDLTTCRASLWQALKDAGDQLQAAQGPDPNAWRADAGPERIIFQPGILTQTARWTNRPTSIQQVIEFK